MTPQERLLKTALAEVGYLEKASNSQLDNPTANPGSKNWNKYAAELDKTDMFNGGKNGYDWCAVFVCWSFYTTFGMGVMRKITGIPAKSLAAGVRYLRQYFDNIGGLVSIPQPGDVIFFKTADGTAWQHTGIVTGVANGYVETVEGNTSGANGQGVHTFRYALTNTRIGGYGRAKWSLVPAEKAPEPAQEQPAEPAKEPEVSKPTPKPEASSWSAEAREKAIKKGVFAGDGTGDYHWTDPLTREQLAVVLNNLGLLG